MYELDEIKILRKRCGLTQKDLAKHAGVSQSLIAKIESKRIDPSFTKAKKIIDSLRMIEKKKELCAKDIMNKKIISVLPDDTLRSAIMRMKKHEISQIPVINESKVCGYVSESIILDKILNGVNSNTLITDVMHTEPPIVPLNTVKEVIGSLLKFFPLVLVSDKGKIKGIITKSDLLRIAYK